MSIEPEVRAILGENVPVSNIPVISPTAIWKVGKYWAHFTLKGLNRRKAGNELLGEKLRPCRHDSTSPPRAFTVHCSKLIFQVTVPS